MVGRIRDRSLHRLKLPHLAAQRLQTVAQPVDPHLESVPGDYGTRIVLGPLAAEEARAEFLVCELDWLRVKGKQEPIAVYELICARDLATEEDHRYVAGYAEALSIYRAGRLSEAATLWEGLRDPRRSNLSDLTPAKVMAKRSRSLKQAPPGWDGVWTRESK
jgi:adenylate cyclase